MERFESSIQQVCDEFAADRQRAGVLRSVQDELGEMKQEVERLTVLHKQYGAVFALAAADIAFISSDGEPALLCSDTFGSACADYEPLPFEEAEYVFALYGEYGAAGYIAWIANVRGVAPLKEFRTDKYEKALEEIRRR